MNNLTRDCLVAAAKELNHPTQGEFAASLWVLCSGNYGLKPTEAAKLYDDCGYVPFKGYPLMKKAA